MILGYARVSKGDEQDTKTQLNALKEAGAERFFEDKASGGRWDRPALQKMLSELRKGDVVAVWKLDRLTRSLKDLLHRCATRIDVKTALAIFLSEKALKYVSYLSFCLQLELHLVLDTWN